MVFSETDSLGIESDIYEQSHDQYLIEYRDNYMVDAQEMNALKEFLQKFIYVLMNLIFLLHTLVVKITILVLDFGINFDMYTLCSFVIEPILEILKETLFDEISLICINIYAFSILIKMLKNQNTQAWTSIMQLLIIIVVALIFFNYPVEILKAVDTGTKYVSSKVLEGPQSAISENASEDIPAAGRAASLIWQIAIHKPWQIVNFGDEDTAKKYEEQILKTKPDTDEREDIIKALSKEGLFSKGLKSATAKFATLCIMCFFTLLICILISAICFFILMYQFLTILYMMGGIFVFIVALLPFVGIRAVYIWGEKVISTASIKIVIVFCLAMVLTFMHIIYQVVDEYGLVKALILQVLIIVTIYIKRDEIIKTFLNFGIVAGKPQYAVERAIRNEIDIENKARAYALKRNQENNQETSSPTMENHKSYNNLRRMEQSATSIRKSTQEMGTYMKKAEELLQKQYNKSVEKTEQQKSDSRNKKADQSDFVKRTNTIRALGVGNFDQRDITKAAYQLKRIEESGGDIDEVIKQSKEPKSITKRPKQLTNQAEQKPKAKMTAKSNLTEIHQKPPQEAFNTTFNTNYDREYFNVLEDEYGKKALKQIVENMVKQETKKKGSIQSPAYHLVKTFENKVNTKPVSMRGKDHEGS